FVLFFFTAPSISEIFTLSLHDALPISIPFSELWLYFWLGEADQFCAKTIFPIFYVVGAFLLVALGQRLAGRRWVGLLLAAFVFLDRKSTRLNSSHLGISYAVFCLKKKK